MTYRCDVGVARTPAARRSIMWLVTVSASLHLLVGIRPMIGFAAGVVAAGAVLSFQLWWGPSGDRLEASSSCVAPGSDIPYLRRTDLPGRDFGRRVVTWVGVMVAVLTLIVAMCAPYLGFVCVTWLIVGSADRVSLLLVVLAVVAARLLVFAAARFAQ